MGLSTVYLNYIESSIEGVFGKSVTGLRMLELGDQVIDDPHIPETTGKDYFTNRGYEHTSVDINGLHGAVFRDLTRPGEFQDWHGSWDILTNSGTTEHVEPFESQYECFGILHDVVKVGGIAIHLIPDIHELDERGAWKNHCRYYYSESFFELLARECEYELLSNTVINGLRCAAVRKTKHVPFMSNRSKFLSSISERALESKESLGLGRTVLSRINLGRLLGWRKLR